MPIRTRRSFFHRLAASRKGIAATEFALIAPVMLTLYFGIAEYCDAMTARDKVTSVAASAGDLVAQAKTITDADITDIFDALDSIVFPYDAANCGVIISSLVDNGDGTVKVAWSDGHNATAHSVGTTIEIPDGLVVSGKGGSVILAEVSYIYSSPAGQLIYGQVNWSDKFYAKPRRVLKITRKVS